jgi:plasmid stabilization system protein ParE
LRIVFLESTLADTRWFRQYYANVFPSGAVTARDSLKRTLGLIAENPLAGQPTQQHASQQFPILRTPFLWVYRIADNRIEVLRLQDQRRPW